MILRKPYAFLIKNFKKIHIFLLILTAYIFYKNSKVGQFVSEFLELGTYDMYNEPISRHINFIVIISLLLVVILSIALVILLKRKNKPWKLYLIPVFEYSLLIIIYILILSYFGSYYGNNDKTLIRIYRDLLSIASLAQYPVFIILLIRIFGIDLNNFNFKMDQEYLELSSGDREEFEVNIDVDKHTFIRGYKRLLRNFGYIYEEHKFIINSIITIFLTIFIVTTYYNVFVLHKSYKQGDYFDVDGYSIRINNSYYTNKDYRGKVISKKDSFVILDLSMKNNWAPRNINFGKFHIMNGISNYEYTSKTYETDFDDLGKTYDEYEIKRNQEIHFILIFKVDKKLDKNSFVLYYQDYIKDKPYLRKIKININDVSNIKTTKDCKLDKKVYIEEGTKKKDLVIEDFELLDNIEYVHQTCETYGECDINEEEFNIKAGEKILKVDFVSDSFEGKDLIDFSVKYGKIDYIDNKGKTKSIKVKSAVDKNYMGQEMYIKVPEEVKTSKTKKFIYVVRDKKYIFKIK